MRGRDRMQAVKQLQAEKYGRKPCARDKISNKQRQSIRICHDTAGINPEG
jgi:hypothetical protein